MAKDLMIPRYEVIADWPEMRDRFKGNPIIELDRYDDAQKQHWTSNGHYWESFFTMYPHLFRKLHWAERRKKDDLPKYVKLNGEVFRVIEWFDEDVKIEEGKPKRFVAGGTVPVHACFPATEQEYLNSLTTKQNENGNGNS